MVFLQIVLGFVCIFGLGGCRSYSSKADLLGTAQINEYTVTPRPQGLELPPEAHRTPHSHGVPFPSKITPVPPTSRDKKNLEHLATTTQPETSSPATPLLRTP